MTPWLLLLVLAQGGAPGDEPGDLLWPLGSGERAYRLRATYGQIEGGQNGVQAGDQLHRGLDVIARVPREAVWALEDGRVVKVDTSDPYRSKVLVTSKRVAGRAFLYLHLDPASIQVGVGDVVAMDDYLADVVVSDPITGVRHLHLARVGKKPSGGWEAKDRWCERNPLALIDRRFLGDAVDPKFEQVSGRELVAVRSDESSPSSPYSKPLDALPSGELDVLVRLFDLDRTGAVYHLAPYRIRLSIQSPIGVLEGEHELVLDGPLGATKAGDVYNLADAFKSVGSSLPPDYDYYFVPSNGGSAPATTNSWHAVPGDHVLKVEASDLAGNSASISVPVAVK